MRWNRDATRQPIRSRRARAAAPVKLLTVVALVAGSFAVGGPVTGATASGAAAAGAALTWSTTPTPSPLRPIAGPMAGVSCSSETSCFAVGTRADIDDIDYPGLSHSEQGPALEIEQWDGTTWSPVASPADGSAAGDYLHAVSCGSATSCVAVGAAGSTVFTNTASVIWNGTSWSVVASPNPEGATSSQLDGVSCASATNCVAVGSYLQGTTNRTLIEQWNGSTWTIVSSPNPSAAVTATLSGVSCSSATRCFAVGTHVDTGTNKGGTLVEQWDGASWTIVATPAPVVRPIDAPAFPPRLTAVSCSSDASCVAVGYTPSDALIEQWNGATWSLLTSPVPGVHSGVAALHGVSCSSATDCSAVGVVFDSSLVRVGAGAPNSIIEHWNGSTWTIVARASGVPNNRGLIGELSDLTAVSCPSGSSCFAVGDSTLPEHWDGSHWSLSSLAASTSYSFLDQVACPTATSCLAVGSAESLLDDSSNTLVEQWNGATWSIVPSPTPSGTNVHAALTSISCPSPTSCTAVGSYDFAASGARSKSIVEHWNGTSWSLVGNPTPAGSSFWGLDAVSCASTVSCNAVGTYQASGRTRLLAEHFNGKTWSIVTIPSPSGAVLNSISCATTTSCFAAGGRGNAKSSGLALIESWNGKTWSIVTTPVPAPKSKRFFQMNGITCRSATDCTAVGFSEAHTFQPSTELTLVEHWNGKSWSVVASPSPANPTGLGIALSSVSCTSPTSCTAVGTAFTAPDIPPPGKPLVEQWNGKSWSTVAFSVPADTATTFLNGVACPTVTTCTAVGGRNTPDGTLTLAAQGS